MATLPVRDSKVKVAAAHHTGITVASLDRAIHLFSNVLNLPIQRKIRVAPPISTISGSPDANINVAIVELPGSHLIELLEYDTPMDLSQGSHKPMPWELGSWHLCLTVEDLEVAVKTLEAACWEGRSMGWKPMAVSQQLEEGPNAGKKLCYLRDDQGMLLELFEGRS